MPCQWQLKTAHFWVVRPTDRLGAFASALSGSFHPALTRYVKQVFTKYVCGVRIVLVIDISVAQIYEHSMHPPPVYSIIGSRIRTRRRQMKLTQERLSRQLGISRASLANIETGRQQILVHQIYNLATQLELDITDLLPPADSIDVSDAVSDLPLPQGLKARDRQLAARAFREADTRELEEGTDDGEDTQSGSSRGTGARRSGPRQRAG
ncbi:MAG: helix-turn-helix domain-containing protein [Chloroflexi bacterium]|nr:helix-turn-helix domain-containing protein [Chloroflexota bacterium]